MLEYFKTFTFSLTDTLRLLEDPGEGATLFIANKMLSFMSYKYLSSSKGVRVVGTLLGLEKPWEQIGKKLGRTDSSELETVINRTADRRNDIVHRADRSEKDADGTMQEVGVAWATQSVDTINHVCLALDELVAEHVRELRVQVQATAAMPVKVATPS